MKINKTKVSIPVMGSFLIVISIFLLLPFKSTAYGNDRVLIGFSDMPLEQVLQKIEEAYKVEFTYTPSVTRNVRKLSLSKKKRSLNEVLYEVAALAGIRFMQIGNLIGIQQSFPVVEAMYKQMVNGSMEEISVRGKVTNAENQPVEGASINIKGNTSKGTTTNNNGEFSIEGQPGEVLIVSSVGYEPQEIEIINSNFLYIVLQSSQKKLEEVVVTALGIKKEKEKVAYAMQEVKGAALEKAPEPNIANNLIGKVAGLNILAKTNLFENPEILLRGKETLVVVDGVPTDKDNFDFWNLNPNDIDNINVLKGTAAAALYGALGINGAIMITTKKGKAGSKGIEITYNTTTQFQAGFLRIPKTQDQYGMGWSGYFAFVAEGRRWMV